VLAYFSTSGVSGFRNFDNHRLHIPLVADGSRPYRQGPNHAHMTKRQQADDDKIEAQVCRMRLSANSYTIGDSRTSFT
jgi:hypothetical protein